MAQEQQWIHAAVTTSSSQDNDRVGENCRQCPHSLDQQTNGLVMRLRAQASFSWGHQILLQQKIRQGTRRAFPNVIQDAYMEVTALL